LSNENGKRIPVPLREKVFTPQETAIIIK